MTEPGEPTEDRRDDDPAGTEGRPVNPDPPHSPGTPEPPDLDVDPEQFLGDGERRGREDEPPS